MFRLLITCTLLAVGCSRTANPTEGSRYVPAEQARPGGRPDAPLHAANFRFFQRVDENGTIPNGALLRAKDQRDAMHAGTAGRGAGAGAPTWQSIGPGNIGGRIRAILIHPHQPDLLWVGSTSGGIWKSIDAGASWAPLDEFLPSLAVGCMAMDPTNPDILYAGTGEGFFETVEGTSNTAAVRGAGIFKSLDGGATWTQLASTNSPDWYFVNRLAISHADPQTLLAATSTGIYRSTNGGASWTRTYSEFAYDVQFHPTDATRAVAGLHEFGALYSTDGGVSWNTAAGLNNGHRVEIRYARGNPAIVYAARSESGRILIYRSLDGGQSFARQTSGAGISTYEAYNSVLWVDPTNSDLLLLGGVQIYRSQDAGVSLDLAFLTVHADHHVFVEAPGFDGTSNRTLYFGNDGGIYRTPNVYGNLAIDLNSNLAITQLYGAGVNPTTGHILAGAQDNGTMLYTGNPNAWQPVFGGDGGFCAADPTDPLYFYGETQYLNIFRSTTGGSSGDYIYQGISDAGTLRTNFIPYFLLDVNEPNRMLAAGRSLWRSDNVKAPNPTWTAIKPSIETEPTPEDEDEPPGAHFAENSPYNISTIAVALGDSDVVWVGHNNGEVWKTANGTAAEPAWTRVDENGVGLPDRWISRIVIDPTDHERVYVSIMGWTSDNVWKTADGGATWEDVSGDGATGLPDAPVSALAQHREQSNWLYAGTDIGVFYSIDDGHTWAPSDAGIGLIAIDELVWKDDRTLMAVTYGRGIYLGDIEPPSCVGDLNGDGLIDLIDLSTLLVHFGETDVGPDEGDLDGDGDVDLDDLSTLLVLFGEACA